MPTIDDMGDNDPGNNDPGDTDPGDTDEAGGAAAAFPTRHLPGPQYFLNMEIERYTPATGETALTGFSRYWRHWGLVFAILTCLANLWPGWVTSSATLTTYLFGGSRTAIAIGMLVVIGLILTLAPVVYVALEKAQMLKVAAVLTFLVIASFFAVGGAAWSDLPQVVTRPRLPIDDLGFALLLGAGGSSPTSSNSPRSC